MHILVLEPFGGGSHAALYQGWQKYSQHTFTILELPAVHWKWRSRHSSLTLALQANELLESGAQFDVVFCSDMLNLPEWRGLANASLCALPTIVYFHENQFTYPLADGQVRDYHFAYSNVLSLIAAKQVWFNSEFHRSEFAASARAWMRRMPDYKHLDLLDAAIDRSEVMPPGIDPPVWVNRRGLPKNAIPTIGWVARWEHDKRPDVFAAVVERLLDGKVEFRLILLGQQFRNRSDALQRILEMAGDRILHSGFAESRDEYWRLLSQIDVVVSTADHEFFGIGIVEAVWAGAQPILPNRLAYPEVLAVDKYTERRSCLYESTDELVDQLVLKLAPRDRPCAINARAVHSFCWSELAKRYDAAVDRLLG